MIDLRNKIPLALPVAGLYFRRMTFRLILCALVALALAGCQAPYKKKDAEDRKPLKDQSYDQSFQAFLGRLRTAVSTDFNSL